jgi:glutaminase
MKYFVIIAEQKTGKILHSDGSIYQEGDADYKIGFDSIEDAISFSEKSLDDHRDREFLVVDGAGKFICVFR